MSGVIAWRTIGQETDGDFAELSSELEVDLLGETKKIQERFPFGKTNRTNV